SRSFPGVRWFAAADRAGDARAAMRGPLPAVRERSGRASRQWMEGRARPGGRTGPGEPGPALLSSEPDGQRAGEEEVVSGGRIGELAVEATGAGAVVAGLGAEAEPPVGEVHARSAVAGEVGLRIDVEVAVAVRAGAGADADERPPGPRGRAEREVTAQLEPRVVLEEVQLVGRIIRGRRGGGLRLGGAPAEAADDAQRRRRAERERGPQRKRILQLVPLVTGRDVRADERPDLDPA